MHSSSMQACLSAPVTVWLNRNLKITSIWATSIRMPGTVFNPAARAAVIVSDRGGVEMQSKTVAVLGRRSMKPR